MFCCCCFNNVNVLYTHTHTHTHTQTDKKNMLKNDLNSDPEIIRL